MRFRASDGLIVALFVLMSVCPSLGTAGEDSSKSQDYSVSGVKEVNSTVIPFDDDQNWVSVRRLPGAHKTAQVKLTNTLYEGQLTDRKQSPPVVRRWNAACYELVSTTPGSDYSWFMWLDNVSAGHFKLFITPDGDTYLTWVSRWALYFTEVSKPKDVSKKMDDKENVLSSGTPGVYTVPVASLLGQEQFVDKKATAHYVSIYLTSLTKDGKGGFRLVLHGRDPSMPYTLASDKDAPRGWRLIDQ